MPAEVETMAWTGRPPWHGLGVEVAEAMNSEEALRLSGLDWRVDLRPTFASLEKGGRVRIPDQFAVVRDSDNTALGVVGKRYTPFQNSEIFEFCDSLCEVGGARYETAGSLHGGRLVWVLAKLTDSNFEVVNGDEVCPYLLGSTRHDGNGSNVWLPTATRVVCANTLRLALSNARGQSKPIVRIAHLGKLHDRLEEAREVLGLARRGVIAFADEARHLASVQFDSAKLEEFVAVLYPDDAESAAEATRTRTANKRAEIVRLFVESPGNDLPGVAGTGWAALNAVTFHTPHTTKIRGKSHSAAEKRLHSQWFGTGSELNELARRTALRIAA